MATKKALKTLFKVTIKEAFLQLPIQITNTFARESSPMSMQTQKASQPIPQKPDEQILVIKRTALFQAQAPQGFLPQNLDSYLTVITDKKEFFSRAAMEKNPRYKQIIPYLIFSHTDAHGQQRLFLMQRTAVASETRLRNKYSLGIGGHIRQEDLSENSIFAWANREFHEEVHYTGTLTVEPLGIVNDDSDEVGTVHLGLVLLLQGNSADISVKSELKQGHLFTLDECKSYAPDMENWSQLVLTHLAK